MDKIKFSREEKAEIVRLIQAYFATELDQEIGNVGAELLLDFFAETIGAAFYNRGLYDAQAVLQTRLDEITDAIYQLEKPVES